MKDNKVCEQLVEIFLNQGRVPNYFRHFGRQIHLKIGLNLFPRTQ